MNSFVLKLVLVSALFCNGAWAGWDRIPGPARLAAEGMSHEQYLSIAAFVCDPEANPIRGLDPAEAKKILYVYFLSFLKRALPPGAQPKWLTSLEVSVDSTVGVFLNFLDVDGPEGIVAALDPIIVAFAHMLYVGEDEGSLPSFLLAEVLGVVTQTVWAHHSAGHMPSFFLLPETYVPSLLELLTVAVQDPSLENATHFSSQILTHMAAYFSTGLNHHMLIELLERPHPQMSALFQSVCHWLNQLNLAPHEGTIQMLQHVVTLNVMFLVSQRSAEEARVREAVFQARLRAERMVRGAVQWGVDHAAALLRQIARGGVPMMESGSVPMGLHVPVRPSNVDFPRAARRIPHIEESGHPAESSGRGSPPAQPQTPMAVSQQADGQRPGLPVIVIHLANGMIMHYEDGGWVTEI